MLTQLSLFTNLPLRIYIRSLGIPDSLKRLNEKMLNGNEIANLFEKIDSDFNGYITRTKLIEYVAIYKLPTQTVGVSPKILIFILITKLT